MPNGTTISREDSTVKGMQREIEHGTSEGFIFNSLAALSNLEVKKKKTARTIKMTIKSGLKIIGRISAKRTAKGILVEELNINEPYMNMGLGKALLYSAIEDLIRKRTKQLVFGPAIPQDTAMRLGLSAGSMYGLKSLKI